jgi:diacylglycerol kinase (ATP)
MSQKHLVFIVNPKSGVQREKDMLAAIEKKLDKEQFSFEIQHTEYAKHGIDLAKAAAEKGVYAVVAVGGDGSVNDIVTGLVGTNTVLAIIPKGSGNGMARTLHIPIDDEAAVELINKEKVVHMDVGFANNRVFISNAGVCFDALIARKFAKSTRRGLMMYSWLVTKHLWTYRCWDWKITIDGKNVDERAFLISVANGEQFGYNFKIAPGADWQDGLLELVVIRRFPKILGGLLSLRLNRGTILSSRYVKHYKGQDIIVSHPELRLIQTDGDAHSCANEIHFRLEKGAQKVIVP